MTAVGSPSRSPQRCAREVFGLRARTIGKSNTPTQFGKLEIDILHADDRVAETAVNVTFTRPQIITADWKRNSRDQNIKVGKELASCTKLMA
ncbi:hypothetical protein BaRGS_00018878 [Batillaria attramentaria]|uniref:Uncharacterized protein n=1 Tax=Batillaria attramentaria TaxID=370345 RepID=A0ABD0KRX7_9CAEN